ncbi:hypothetical protein HHK36_013902 [Tetracentron sinense]|uniref:BSD domain-containing protein n=1 Tax=Tetracentron sinense TaxID=13715 RepID=A0A835DEM0_TETSI|nr:hypothetical protein HHK36_013902 [Tetracentron sinense]
MSWFSISLPNPFKPQEPDEENLTETEEKFSEEEESSSNGGGVKEDLSELRKTIGRQLWGVASFLAPPPVTDSDALNPPVTPSDSSSQTFLGIRNDFAEIGGTFKSGLSLLSTNKAVNGISRLASKILQFQKEDDGDEFLGEDFGGEGSVIGVTKEVLRFVQEMSLRPECWVDFPLSLDNDFDMSDAQREHASTVERFAPSLAALRLRLCPTQLFKIVEARDTLLQKLQNRTNAQVKSSRADNLFVEVSIKDSNIQEESGPVQEKEFLAETLNSAHQEKVDELENIEQWLEEEDVVTGTSADAQKQLGKEEDVSFSDLEDDDDVSSRQLGLRLERVSSPSGSNEWIQLGENSDMQRGQKKAVPPTSREKDSEGESSNDWLAVDDFNSDSSGTA